MTTYTELAGSDPLSRFTVSSSLKTEWPRHDEPLGAASWGPVYAWRMPPSAGPAGRRGPERGREDL